MAVGEIWREIRQAVLERDGHRCRDCGGEVRSAEADVHHLVPRSLGGPDDASNLITLCDGCHGARHPNLQGKLSRRFVEKWAVRLARLVDIHGAIPRQHPDIGPVLRLLGKDRLRDGQLEAVLAALRGENVLVVRPTGSGKSLCFQVPTLTRPGLSLVIVPLKALMSEQVVGLQKLKIPATFINGDLGPAEKEIRYRWLEEGIIKFAFVAPERFDEASVRPEEAKRMAGIRPTFLVVDEAHSIDRWGDSFRPSYGELGEIRKRLGSPPVLAFTATAGASTQKRILESLGVPHARAIVSGVDRPNISLFRAPIEGMEEKLDLAASLLAHAHGKTMIFVPSKPVGAEVQSGLGARGFDLEFYHATAGTANERDMLLGRFTGRIDPPIKAIICTNAFGMGLDVPDVRLVIHMQHPSSVEDYLQEFGRAGRDGKPSTAVLFVGSRDVGRLRFMIEKSLESQNRSKEEVAVILERKLSQLAAMRSLAEERHRCFRRGILDYFDSGARQKRPLSIRILDAVFASEQKVHKGRACCDRCNPVEAERVLQGFVPL